MARQLRQQGCASLKQNCNISRWCHLTWYWPRKENIKEPFGNEDAMVSFLYQSWCLAANPTQLKIRGVKLSAAKLRRIVKTRVKCEPSACAAFSSPAYSIFTSETGRGKTPQVEDAWKTTTTGKDSGRAWFVTLFSLKLINTMSFHHRLINPLKWLD